MKAVSLQFCCFLFIFIVLFSGCKSAKTTFSFHPEPGNKAAIVTDSISGFSSSESVLQGSQKQAKTVAFYHEKVMPAITQFQPETNTKATAAPTQKISTKQLNIRALKKIKDIKDGPTGGPWSLISGIFLGIGMALLLAALVMAIIGTSGAGTLAFIGGSSFLAGAIVAIISLLKY